MASTSFPNPNGSSKRCICSAFFQLVVSSVEPHGILTSLSSWKSYLPSDHPNLCPVCLPVHQPRHRVQVLILPSVTLYLGFQLVLLGTTSLLFLMFHQVQLPFVAAPGTNIHVKRNQPPSQSPLKPMLCHIPPCSWDQSIKVSAAQIYHHLASRCSLDTALLSLCSKTVTSEINFIRFARYVRAIIFYLIILICSFLIVLSSKERSHYSVC